MRIGTDQLLGLPVRTEAGAYLGKVAAIILDTELHTVQNYVVHAGNFLPLLSGSRLLISPAQVISITAEAMIVSDNSAREAVAKEKKLRGTAPAPLALTADNEL